MANHALPTASSLYTDVLTNLKDRIDDSLKMLDSVNTSPTSVPTNAVRWNSTTKLWEKYNGSIWVSLAASYAIQVLKSTNLVGGNGTTLLGSMPYQSNTDTTTLLAPNTTTTRKFLRQTGTGTNGAAPVWDEILASDVPTLNQSTTGNAATATKLTNSSGDWQGSGAIANVVGMLAWKNYGNEHVIFDASHSTSPNGSAINNTNAQTAWSPSYPTLMGWNGGQTYGVRVDSARVADTATTATKLTTARTINGVSFNGSANINIEDRLGTAIASATTTTIGTAGLGDYIHITGTTTITSFGTASSAGIRRTLIFDGALTITHNATSLICAGASNIVTVAGTVIEVIAETTANWRVVSVTHPSVSHAELGYLDGVTSNIQTQFNTLTTNLDALKDVPTNTQSTSYTLALTDRGKSIDTSAGVTVPLNATVAFPIGTVITITNTSAAAITLTQTAGVTLRQAGTANTGNRTLAAYGMATLRKVAVDTWFISGAGLS